MCAAPLLLLLLLLPRLLITAFEFLIFPVDNHTHTRFVIPQALTHVQECKQDKFSEMSLQNFTTLLSNGKEVS